MGNEISENERNIRYQLFHESIYAIEKDIKSELWNKNIKDKKYSKFGLINQGIFKKYPFLLKEKFDKNDVKNINFKYKDLIEKTEDKNFSYIYNEFEFGFPSDFFFIRSDFMDLIREYIGKSRKKLNTNYDIIIGGGCLIMKDAQKREDTEPFRYIVLYQDIKNNIGNNIDFFLHIKDIHKRKSAIDFILENNLWNYFKKIEYNYKEEYKMIFEEKKKIFIGYIVRSNDISRIENFIKKTEEKKDQIPSNFMNEKNKEINSKMFSEINNITNIKTEKILDSIILSFFQFEKLKQSFDEKRNLDFQSFKNIIINKVGDKLISLKNPTEIFEEILSKLDSNSKTDNYNQVDQYDKQKGLETFIKRHKNSNIITHLFLIPKQETTFCQECKFETYNFTYDKFIFIKNPENEFLYQKLFFNQTEKIKGKKCIYCNGKITECLIKNEFIGSPEILIVIIEPNKVKNFSLQKNLNITNKKNINYTLKQFIEINNNLLYLFDIHNNICQKYDENNKLGNPENINDKIPFILFYQLSIINNQINNNNIQNNNIKQNINDINTKMVLNYRNIKKYQNMNDSNNIINNQNINNNNFQNNNNNFPYNFENMNNYNMNNLDNKIQTNININNKSQINNIQQQQLNPNQNNNINSNIPDDNNIQSEDEYISEENNPDLIFIKFTFKKVKQIYIDVDKNSKFKDVLSQLEDKYEWLKDIENKYYIFNDKKIEDFNQNILDLGIKDSSDIFILTNS